MSKKPKNYRRRSLRLASRLLRRSANYSAQWHFGNLTLLAVHLRRYLVHVAWLSLNQIPVPCRNKFLLGAGGSERAVLVDIFCSPGILFGRTRNGGLNEPATKPILDAKGPAHCHATNPQIREGIVV